MACPICDLSAEEIRRTTRGLGADSDSVYLIKHVATHFDWMRTAPNKCLVCNRKITNESRGFWSIVADHYKGHGPESFEKAVALKALGGDL